MEEWEAVVESPCGYPGPGERERGVDSVRVSKNFSFCLCFASGPLVDRLQGGVF